MAVANDRGLAVADADEYHHSLLEEPELNAHPGYASPSPHWQDTLAPDPFSLQPPSRLDLKSADDPRLSGNSSRSVSIDLELETMRQDDPLYANVLTGDVRNRPSLGPAKQRDWLDTGQHNGTMDSTARENEARRLGTKHFVHKTLINALLIALWYILSISMSVYNKWMFSPGNLDFHFPLFSTAVHMLVQFLLASSILYLFPQYRPERAAADARNPHDPENNQSDNGPRKPLMTLWFYLTRIASCGAVTGLDIGLGNTSLKFISLTFFTMVKSSTLGFVLGFAILFRLEAPSYKIGGIIAVMTLGVILMVSGETAFDAVGFALLMLASFFSGLRWSLTQILLRRTPATSNPFSTLFFLTPVMFAVLFVIAVPAETFPALADGLDTLAQKEGLALGMLIVLFPGCIAFCMTAAEFALLKRTSVVTLSVCGIFKEVLTITAAGLIFGDELTPINISGLLITIAAIAVYNWTRMRRMKRMEISKARGGGGRDGAGAANIGSNAANTSDERAAATTDATAMQGFQSLAHKGGEAVSEEAAPMLPPPASPPLGKSEGAVDHNDEEEGDDDDDVVMIQGGGGGADGHDPRPEHMRQPVRAFFEQTGQRHGTGGYAPL